MCICLSTAKDHFRKTGTDLSVHIQFGISHLIKRSFPKIVFCFFNRNLTLFYFFQYFSHIHLFVHLVFLLDLPL